ncbi:hypothetical protein C7C56_014340, partial [Massilia glaciei]
MSLINKMLQDLDARGSQAGPAMQADIRPVAHPERAPAQRALVLGLAGAALVAGGAAGGWLFFKRPQAAPEVPAAVVNVLRVPVQQVAAAPTQAARRAPDPAPAPGPIMIV